MYFVLPDSHAIDFDIVHTLQTHHHLPPNHNHYCNHRLLIYSVHCIITSHYSHYTGPYNMCMHHITLISLYTSHALYTSHGFVTIHHMEFIGIIAGVCISVGIIHTTPYVYIALHWSQCIHRMRCIYRMVSLHYIRWNSLAY